MTWTIERIHKLCWASQSVSNKKPHIKPGVVEHACNPRTQKEAAGCRSLGQPDTTSKNMSQPHCPSPNTHLNQAQEFTPLIPVLVRLHCEFKGQPGLQSNFSTNRGYRVKLCLRTQSWGRNLRGPVYGSLKRACCQGWLPKFHLQNPYGRKIKWCSCKLSSDSACHGIYPSPLPTGI